MNRKLNKNLITIMRVVMFCLGATLGAVAMWQFLSLNPSKINANLKIVFYIASGLFAALVLFFSSKPILHLIFAAGDGLKKLFKRTKPLEMAGILLGIAIGIMFTYLVEALLGLILKVVSIRIIIDVIAGLVASYIAALLCVRWLSGGEQLDVDTCGYIVTSGALKHPKIAAMCANWLDGTIFVLSITVDTLIDTVKEAGTDGLTTYRELSGLNKIKTISHKWESTELDCINEVALKKHLKVICVTDEGAITVSPLNIDTL